MDNRPGGNTIIGTEAVAKAPADGYTMVLTHVGTMAVNPYMLTNQPYDVNRDFAPVTLLAKVPNVFVIHPDVPAKDFSEFVAHVKAHPGQLNYGSAGNASAGHLAMEYLKLVTGMNITHIPYRGTAPAVTDLLGGQVDMMFLPIHVALAHVKTGRLVALAIGSERRHPLMPELPTVTETGLGQVNVGMWFGVFAPKGMPPDQVSALNRDINQILAGDDVKTAFSTQGMDPASSSPAEFARLVERDADKWARLVKSQGIKPE